MAAARAAVGDLHVDTWIALDETKSIGRSRYRDPEGRSGQPLTVWTAFGSSSAS
jgi:hypothetical protein